MRRAYTTPFRVMLGVALLLVLIVLGATAAVRMPPWLGLNLAPHSDGYVAVLGVDPGGPAARALAGQETPARLLAVDDQPLTSVDLIEESDTLPSYADVRALFSRQNVVLQSLERGVATLHFQSVSGARFAVEVTPGQRPVSDLPVLFWLQLVFGAGALLIGGWLWSLRPRDLSVIMFALTGVGLLLATGPAAIYSSRELALDGGLFRALSAINHIGAFAFGAGMVSVFLLYPRQLLKTHRAVAGVWVAMAVWWVIDITHHAINPPIGSYLPVLVLTAMIFALIGWQWWTNRKDPRNRAALRWLGLSVFVGISGYVVGQAGPTLLGDGAKAPQGLFLGSFLIIYVGLALGVGRYRLFQLDQWAYRTVFYTGGALAVLAFDAALIAALQIEAVAALGVSLLLIGLLYLPLRDTFWRWLTARRTTSPDALFGMIMETAFAGPQIEREARWRDLMMRLFEPSSLEVSDQPVAAPAILEDGLEMRVPATAAGPALTLRFARGGRSLFRSEDLALARQSVDLIAQAETSRLAYERGASEERRRIAQDLHDDVGARLLSGLHKPDLPQTRNALREAIADIRMVVGGLAGERRPLDHVLADLRHEAAERLPAAGLTLDWPIDEDDSGVSVDYVLQKALRSALREIVSNTIRHAEAKTVTVRIQRSKDSLRLVASDDGVGLKKTLDGERRGFGLVGLGERMEALGGTMSLPKVERGLTVDLTFNLAGRTSPTAATAP